MNVLIDTNIALDILLKREPYFKNAARISILSEKGYIRCYISASAVTDIYYIVKKELKNKDVVIDLLKKLLKTINIAAVTETAIYEALDLGWNDFEDSVQYVSGQKIRADFIITRNPKDFTESLIKVRTPDEFVNQIARKK